MSYRKGPFHGLSTSYTPVIGGSPSTTATGGKYFVDSNGIMHLSGYADISGAGAAATVTINIPDGYKIDTSRLASGNSTANDVAVNMVGNVEWFDSGVAFYDCSVYYTTDTTLSVKYSPGVLLANQFAAGDGLKWNIQVPVI